ncbi:uncharacterized protein LOC143521557 isoform X4 [Brachyhypopomus gauderio]|uniref:uncharacterized protein LOC143521557 isoform X4 n=1 Tax=Brachyhypopomus gauderio TaxID=698409 RepID=UPI00404216F4
MHHALPPEASFSPPQCQGETKSHPSDVQGETEHHLPHAVEVPATPPLQPESSRYPTLGLADAFTPQSQSEADSTSLANQATEAPVPPILPAQEPLSSTVSKDNEVTNLVTCEEPANHFDANVWEDIALEERRETESPFTDVNARPPKGAFLEEVDMTESTDATRIDSDLPDQLQEKEQDSVDTIVNSAANNQVDQLNPASEPTFHHDLAVSAMPLEQHLTHSDFEENMDARPSSKQATPPEREEPEGDNIPSLAQALKELHELLMSSAHAQACERSPPPASRTTTTGRDTEGEGPEPIMEDCASLNPTVDVSSSHTATTNETNFAKSEHAALAEDGTIEIPTISPQGQEENQTNGVANINVEQGMTQSSHIPEGNRVGGNEGGSVAEPGEASPLQGCFEFREASESQQGRGHADGRTSDVDPPRLAEGSQQRPLSVAVDSSVDSSSLVPVASSHPSTQSTRSVPLLADSIQPSSTLTSTGQYPAEHIQRIQAAGFSSHEAAEALDRAEGSVELALLVLLARKITVPT